MGPATEAQEMTAELRNQRAAGARVALAPAAIAGLLGAALLIGGLLGVVTKSQLDAITTNQAAAPVVASNAASRLLIERNARIAERASSEAAAPVVTSNAPSRLLIERNARIAERASAN
jgi:hypothetical protein